ncbi:unnamed protein product [Parajaminaea phylloscopi]
MDPWASPWAQESQDDAATTQLPDTLHASSNDSPRVIKDSSDSLQRHFTSNTDLQDDPWAHSGTGEPSEPAPWSQSDPSREQQASWNSEGPIIQADPADEIIPSWTSAAAAQPEASTSTTSATQQVTLSGEAHRSDGVASEWTATDQAVDPWRPADTSGAEPSGYAGSEMWGGSSSREADQTSFTEPVATTGSSSVTLSTPDVTSDAPPSSHVTTGHMGQSAAAANDVTAAAPRTAPVRESPFSSTQAEKPTVGKGTAAATAATNADAGEGWQMEKPKGAAALAGKVGGWISGAVTSRIRSDAAPPVVHATDGDDSLPAESFGQPVDVGVLDDTAKVDSPAVAAAVESSPTKPASGPSGFWGRWRKQQPSELPQKQATGTEPPVSGPSAPSFDDDSLDWLTSQTRVPGNPGRPPQQAQLQFAPPMRTLNSSSRSEVLDSTSGRSSPFDFDVFESSRSASRPSAASTQLARGSRTSAPNSTAVRAESQDPFAMFDSLHISHGSAASGSKLSGTLGGRPQMSAMSSRPVDLLDGRADDNDLEAVGYDYRDMEDDDEEATVQSTAWQAEKPTPLAPSKGVAPRWLGQASANTSNHSADSLSEPRRSFSPTSLGSISLKRASSSASSSMAASSAAGAGKRGSLLPPPPSTRTRTIPGPAIANPTKPQPPPQRPASHLSTQHSRPSANPTLSEGRGMTSDDLAFFENL